MRWPFAKHAMRIIVREQAAVKPMKRRVVSLGSTRYLRVAHRRGEPKLPPVITYSSTAIVKLAATYSNTLSMG